MQDSPLRSIAKSISWRLTGTIDTIILASLITGQTTTGLSIGAFELFTKIILYYFHERVWNMRSVRFYFVVKRNNHLLAVYKSISWRITGTIDTIIISLIITGNISNAFSIGLAEVVTKMILYYFHERIWQKIHFGRIPTMQ